MLKFCFSVLQGCHALGKSQGNLNFLQGQGILQTTCIREIWNC